MNTNMGGLSKERGLVLCFTFLVGLFSGVVAQTGVCIPADQPADMQTCLSTIRQMAVDPSNFWFGSSYGARCNSPALGFTINCFNPHRAKGPQTLAQLTFGINNPVVSTVDRYLTVKYTSGSGSYQGCDYNYNQTDTKEFFIDPTSSTSYTPWDLRDQPDISWDSSSGDLFTLIVVDVAYGWLHGFYVNIPDNNINLANEIDSYHGPRHFREVGNPYAFLLYKQNARIDASRIFLPPMTPFNVTEADQNYQFGTLVGMSWALASYDAYALGLQAGYGWFQNCAALVSDAYKSHPDRSFLPDTLPSSVYLRLRISHDNFTYSCGQEGTKYQPEADFYVDPIGRPVLNTADARSASTYTFSMQMNKMFPNNTVDFRGKMYSLMMLDPDIPASLAAVGNENLPLLHGLHTDIIGNNFTTGLEIQPFIGPGPPDTNIHIYYFLLFEQQGPLQLDGTSTYTSQCQAFPRLKDRCKFDVTKFTTDNNLQLVGATWFTATNDDYVRCNSPQSSLPEEIGGCSLPMYSLHLLICIFVLNLFL